MGIFEIKRKKPQEVRNSYAEEQEQQQQQYPPAYEEDENGENGIDKLENVMD